MAWEPEPSLGDSRLNTSGSFSNYQNPTTHAAGTMGDAIVQDTEYSKSFQVGLLLRCSRNLQAHE